MNSQLYNFLHCVLLLLLMATAPFVCAQSIGSHDSVEPNTPTRIIVGAEQMELIEQQTQGKSVAVVANQASLVKGKHLVDTLLAKGIDIKRIFCPEHGFRGDSEAGASVKDGIDATSCLPLVSLYGKNIKPTPNQLNDITLVIFDLQDVGCRFYTYISTLHYVMEACAENHVPLLLLDRPNPNAHYVDGPVLEPAYRSFVGMHPVPIVYGMTIGEYATMINGECWLSDSLQCDLTVVALQNYTHDSCYHLPIAPSPNLQTDQAIALYPSLCLFEGTNISVGRGTDSPFEIIGNPRYKPLPASANSITFTPRSIPHVCNRPPFEGTKCYGMSLKEEPRPTQINLDYLIEMYRGTPHNSFFLKNNFFEKLAGTAMLRKQLQQGATAQEIRDSWEPALSLFKEIRSHYLLYK